MRNKRVLLLFVIVASVVSLSTYVYCTTSHATEVTSTAVEQENTSRLDDETVELLCNQNYIASSLVYAVRECGYNLDETDLISQLGSYASLSDTDEEVDLPDALVNIIGCSYDEALNIIDTSDSIQEETN